MQHNFTRTALFRPENRPVFSGHQSDWTFDAQASSLSLQNAWWLCNLSHLAYFDVSEGLPALQKWGFSLEAFIDDHGADDSGCKLIKDTRAYIVSSDCAVMLAFSGLSPGHFPRQLTDGYQKPVDFPGKGRTHSGYFGALNGTCWEKIVSVLLRPALKNRPLWITGHGLGAALATIAAARLNPHGLYMFASPKVGDSKFCTTFKHINSQRFVNCSDWMPRLPNKNRPDYLHIDTLQYFNAAGDLLENPAEEYQHRDSFKARLYYPVSQCPIPFLNQKIFSRKFADHCIDNYRYGIWKALTGQN